LHVYNIVSIRRRCVAAWLDDARTPKKCMGPFLGELKQG